MLLEDASSERLKMHLHQQLHWILQGRPGDGSPCYRWGTGGAQGCWGCGPGSAVHIRNPACPPLHAAIGKVPRDAQPQPLGLGPTYLPAAAAVMLPADDGEGGFARSAEATGLVRDPLRRVCDNRSGGGVSASPSLPSFHILPIGTLKSGFPLCSDCPRLRLSGPRAPHPPLGQDQPL